MVHPQIAIFFTLVRLGGVKIWPKEDISDAFGLRMSQEFVFFLSHSSISIRAKWLLGGGTPHDVK